MEIDSPNAIGESTGFGIPTGGTVNQLLVKNSSTNFDTSWSTPIGSEGLYQAFTGITQGRAVRLGQNGKIYPMDFVGVENQPIIGIAQTSGATNTFIRVILEGGLSTASTGLTPSYNYYASTNGSLTLTGETYVGTAVSGDTLQVWFGSPNGVVIPSLSIIDNSITDPANITIPGRYIVPVSGLTGQFIGEQNDYADYNGVGFTFTIPTNNDKVVITTGPNSGNVYLFASGATSGWTISSQTTSLPTSNWSSGVSYKQFDMVIYQSVLYQANGNVPANTAFNVGTSGATFKQIGVSGVAEYGSIYATNGSTTGSSSLSDLPGATLTLPSAGVYRVYYNIYTTNDADGAAATFSISNSTNTIYSGSSGISIKVPGAATASVASQEITITVSAPTTIKVRWRTAGTGTATIVNNNISGNSVFGYEKIAGFMPAVGQTSSIAKYTRTTTQTALVAYSDIICNVAEVIGGDKIRVNTTTGSVTLASGNTYRLRGQVGHCVNIGAVPSAMSYQWYNVTTNSWVGQPSTVISLLGGTNDGVNMSTAEYVVTPSTNSVFQLKILNATSSSSIQSDSGTASYTIGAPFIDIEQLGTTNTSAFTGVISPTWNISNSYPLGTMVVNSGVLYQANSFIPANTSFTIGTTGATWNPIGIGIPTGGTANQVLIKNSSTNFDTSWKTTNQSTSSFTLYSMDTNTYPGGVKQNFALNSYTTLSGSSVTFTVPSGFTTTKVLVSTTMWGDADVNGSAAGSIRTQYSISGYGVVGASISSWASVVGSSTARFNLSNIGTLNLAAGTYTIVYQAQRESEIGAINNAGQWGVTQKVEVFVK